MKIIFVGTYPPRKCGIGTFTNNLVKAIAENFRVRDISNNIDIVAINDQEQTYNYPSEVKRVIRQNEINDYINAAQYINYSGADICFIEHEFGIFGGESGVYILTLINRLKIPLIVTLHTVLKEPSFIQKAIVQEIGKRADKIVVMSSRAVEFLVNIYQIASDKITIIEHGVPSVKILHPDTVRKKFNLENKKVLLTFGLLSRNKGIETVIRALRYVVDKHKDVLYIVLGTTHPIVLRHYGEEYREYLLRLVKEYKLENHVTFYNTFVTDENLMEFLIACDLYITPYLNEAQITSGTLSYAIGAGAAVISTPYWHAQELLAENRGKLFNFNDHIQLAEILNDLLDNPSKIEQLRRNAYVYGQKLSWNKIGYEYIKLSEQCIAKHVRATVEKEQLFDPLLLPEFSLNHILRLTDDTGIVQHAKYGIPNLKEGYCLDDNSRALLLTLKVYDLTKDSTALKLMPIYLSFIHYMQNEDGTFRNFLSFNRQYLDDVGSEDCFGRTIWALGYLIHKSPNDAYHQLGKEIFDLSRKKFNSLKYPRGIANTIIGISYYLKTFPADDFMLKTLYDLNSKMVEMYQKHSDSNWKWFENSLTYDNGILPYALFCSMGVYKDEKMISVAIESAKFLESVTMRKGYLTPVGSNGWYVKGGQCAEFAQQSIDVMSMVLMFNEAYSVTKDKEYLNKMFKSFMWFLGENDLNIPIYDFETNGCNDGLEKFGVNRNQGAESTIAYLISHLTVLNTIKLEYEYENN